MGEDDEVDDLAAARTVTVTDRVPGVTPPEPIAPVTGAPLDAARYELRDEVARGGGGRVVRAFDRKLGREVAIKFPHDDDAGETLRRRLEREARILAGLEHPAIVPIHDAGVWRNGRPYFAMRLLGGRTLKDAMRAAGGFDARLGLLPITAAIADAMAYAHGHGVIHRDLKPGNVVVGDLGDTVVIDWGLAKRRDDEELRSDGSTAPRADTTATDATVPAALTATGAVMGTPAYMAPEQARGDEADARTDVYAIGVILYELLAGARPYAGRDNAEVAAQILAGPPPPLDEREPRVRAELVAIVAKAMARDPAVRYRDAGALAEDLRHYQAGRLVAAHRYSRAALAGRWLRRRAVALSIGVAVAAIGGAGVLALATPRRAAAGLDCARSGDQVRQVWTPARRAAVIAAFDATGLPYARGVADAVLPRIDRAADALADAHVEVCRATARGQQSAPRHDLRMSCLAQQVAQFDATLAVLTTADAKVVDAAPPAIDSLADPRACADVARLSLLPPEPVDLDARAALAGLRKRLAASQAARIGERDRELLDEVRSIAAAAEAVGYCPVTVQARYGVASILDNLAGNKEETVAAVALLRRAEIDADACGEDEVRANAIIDQLEAWDDNDLAGLELRAAEARAAAHRLSDPRVEIRLLVALGETAQDAGDVDRAIGLLDEARAASARSGVAGVAWIDFDLAKAWYAKGDLDRAQVAADASIAALRRDYGDAHPNVSKVQQVIGAIYLQRGEAQRAFATFEEVVRIRERAYGPEHQMVLRARDTLALALAGAGEYERAVAQLEINLPIAERVFGADHDQVVMMTSNLASMYVELGRFDEALVRARAALNVRLRTVGRDHPETARARSTLGQILEDRGEHSAAIAELRAALAIQTDKLDADGPDAIITAAYLGIALVEAGRPAAAIPLLRRSLAVYQQQFDATALASTEVALGRALWDTAADRRQARALVAAAEARAAAHPKVRDRAARWLAAHPP